MDSRTVLAGGGSGLPGLEELPVAAVPIWSPPEESPKMKLMEGAAEYLSDCELLSLVLPSRCPAQALERARALLAQFGSLSRMAKAGVPELARQAGLPLPAACKLHAALLLATRLTQWGTRGQRIRIDAPGIVAEVVRPLCLGSEQEEFRVLLLNPRHHLLRNVQVTRGLADRCQVHAREVFRPAIRESASRLILAHNHPSGDPTPSRADVECTKGLVAAGKLIGIEVIDHVIVGEPSPTHASGFFSFKEANMLE